MKPQVVVPVKGFNVEHRTSNIEHRMMSTLSHRGVGLMPYGPEAEA